MARIDPARPILTSILDRLIDEDPDTRHEALRSARPVLRDLRQSVRRDLEVLLNTRVRPLTYPARLPDVERSVIAFGIPDVTAMNMSGQAARDEFLRLIEALIRRYEPRFKTVRVVPIEKGDSLDRTLRFRVEALLYAEPSPEPIAFASTLEPITHTFAVEGA